MAHLLTKHRPGYREQQPPINEPHRTVAMPESLRAISVAAEADDVSLGSREPSDGRYVSLVRSTFLHRTVQPSGESSVGPLPANQITLEKQHRTQQNRERQYYIGPSAEEVTRSSSSIARLRTTPSPALEDGPHAMHDPEESKKNASNMRACHVYVSTTDQDAWKHGSASLMRTDIGKNVIGKQGPSASDRAELRNGQRQTHFALGTYEGPVTSESRGMYRGAHADRAKLQANVASTIQLGMSSVDVKDTLRSLKQVDFVPHEEARKQIQEQRLQAAIAAANRSVVTADTDSLVLGYDGTNAKHASSASLTTLYRSSYTPVSFSSPVRKH